MVDLRWNAIFEGLEALPGMAILGGSSLLQGWKQLEQVALLPQLLQPCPQHLLHPRIKQSQCPTQNPPAAAPAAPWPWSHSCRAPRGAHGSIRTLSRGHPRPGVPRSHRGFSASPGALAWTPGCFCSFQIPACHPVVPAAHQTARVANSRASTVPLSLMALAWPSATAWAAAQMGTAQSWQRWGQDTV